MPPQLPSYKKGEHLKGPDLKCYTKATEDFKAVFGTALAQGAGWSDKDEKALHTKVKSTIRTKVKKYLFPVGVQTRHFFVGFFFFFSSLSGQTCLN